MLASLVFQFRAAFGRCGGLRAGTGPIMIKHIILISQLNLNLTPSPVTVVGRRLKTRMRRPLPRRPLATAARRRRRPGPAASRARRARRRPVRPRPWTPATVAQASRRRRRSARSPGHRRARPELLLVVQGCRRPVNLSPARPPQLEAGHGGEPPAPARQ